MRLRCGSRRRAGGGVGLHGALSVDAQLFPFVVGSSSAHAAASRNAVSVSPPALPVARGADGALQFGGEARGRGGGAGGGEARGGGAGGSEAGGGGPSFGRERGGGAAPRRAGEGGPGCGAELLCTGPTVDAFDLLPAGVLAAPHGGGIHRGGPPPAMLPPPPAMLPPPPSVIDRCGAACACGPSTAAPNRPSLEVLISRHISPHLATSRHISPHLAQPALQGVLWRGGEGGRAPSRVSSSREISRDCARSGARGGRRCDVRCARCSGGVRGRSGGR